MKVITEQVTTVTLTQYEIKVLLQALGSTSSTDRDKCGMSEIDSAYASELYSEAYDLGVLGDAEDAL